jgi:sugar O-acyltransferase (sialic acid O-acetyltransferase NeuD family)
MKRNLVLFGDGLFADIAYEYFTHDSDYQVVAFCVDRPYLQCEQKFGLPVIATDEIAEKFNPAEHSFYAAITYGQLNRVRERFFNNAKKMGYTPASYISSRAFVWRNVELGEHCFIFEDNTVQPFVKLGDNVVLWSGNHIGHHSEIGNHVFIASHAVISGCCHIGDHQFIGVNATLSNNLTIADDCMIGAAALVTRNMGEDGFAKGARSEVAEGARRFFKVVIE